MKYQSDYPIPAITTTAVIVVSDGTCQDKVLLVKRKNEPFKDQWCFPGGFFNQFEDARACCIREVAEETGMDVSRHCAYQPFDVISNKDRDPRGWVIDCPFLIQLDKEPQGMAGDDASEIGWFTFEEVKHMILAFDHNLTFAHAISLID